MRARAAPPSPAVFEIAFESMRTNSMTTKVLALNLNGNLSHYVGSGRARSVYGGSAGGGGADPVPSAAPRPGDAQRAWDSLRTKHCWQRWDV